jgi:hypothetical protein
MHKITQQFLNAISNDAEQHGVVLYDYERLYKYRMHYSKWSGIFYELEHKRKPLRAAIYNELREYTKSQKDAEMQAECHESYVAHIDKLCEARKVSLEAYALLSGLEAKIEHEKSKEITKNIEKRHNNPQGYGS